MKTKALALIVKDELLEVKNIVDTALPYFDAIYITVTDEDALGPFQDLLIDPKVHIDYFKWVKNFAKARNHNWSNIKEDYAVWMDADDTVDWTHLDSLIARMEDEKLDALYLPYDYAQDEFGNCVALHWRERIIRTAHPFQWKGAVHETLISPIPVNHDKDERIVFRHHNPLDAMKESMGRNLEILEAEYAKGDPRIAHYLGITYYSLGRYKEAIKVLRTHIEKSGWDEESYRSHLRIAESYNALNSPDMAVNELLNAAKLQPDYPDAYLMLAQVYFEVEEYEKCLEWLSVANSKQIPETLSIIDPTMYGFRATMLACMANLQLGRIETAAALLKEVLKANPDYPVAKNLEPVIREELLKLKATQHIRELSLYFKDDKRFLEGLYEALPGNFQYDPRVAPLRNMVKTPQTWGDKSIVLFCGNTFEDWGPDTLDKGMGGSEEAVVNLSREWTKMGYEVTVYNTRDQRYDDPEGGTWLPWYHIDYRDQFNVLICWRAPEIGVKMEAKLKLLDVHDVLTAERVTNHQQYYDKILVKTDYHRTLYPDVPDDKFVIIGNGIDPSHFKPAKKKAGSVLYASAPDRGLSTLLDLWPKIRAQVPTATLDWYYGWESYVGALGQDNLYHSIKAKFERLKDQGVTERGRVSHQELADAMGRTKVWAYPTEFPEIFCITAVKAEQAGMIPVTTGYAALAETQTQGVKLPGKIYTDPELQDRFVQAVVKALKSDTKITPPKQASWAHKAKQWAKLFPA